MNCVSLSFKTVLEHLYVRFSFLIWFASDMFASFKCLSVEYNPYKILPLSLWGLEKEQVVFNYLISLYCSQICQWKMVGPRSMHRIFAFVKLFQMWFFLCLNGDKNNLCTSTHLEVGWVDAFDLRQPVTSWSFVFFCTSLCSFR